MWLTRPRCSISNHSLRGWFAALLTVIPVTCPVLEEMLQRFPGWLLTPLATEAHILSLLVFLMEDSILLLLTSGSQADRKEELRMKVVAAP